MKTNTSDERSADIPQWFVVHTNPGQEQRATDNLTAWGVETFNPSLKSRRAGANNRHGGQHIKPLFPRYIFARFPISLLAKVVFTRGVHSVVCFGGRPAPVDDEIIRLIKSNIGKDGFVKIGQEFKHGDRVMVKDGPLSGLIGIFERPLKEADRVIILLTMINYQGRVMIDSNLLKKVS